MNIFDMFENKPNKKTVKENSWSAGDNAWSSEHDQWAKESINEYPAAASVPADSESPIQEAPKGDRWRVLCKYPDLRAGPNHIASITWTGFAPDINSAKRYAIADLTKSGKKDVSVVRATCMKPKVDEAFADQGAGHSVKDSQPIAHRIGVTVLDPNATDVTQRKEPIQKTIRVKGSKETALSRAANHYKNRGYRVVDAWYISPVFPVSESTGISQQELADVLYNRLELRYPDAVTRYGHEVVGDTVLDVAGFHAGAEELGSSDISIMLREIMKELERRGGAGEVDEGAFDKAKEVAGRVAKTFTNPVGAASDEHKKPFWTKDIAPTKKNKPLSKINYVEEEEVDESARARFAKMMRDKELVKKAPMREPVAQQPVQTKEARRSDDDTWPEGHPRSRFNADGTRKENFGKPKEEPKKEEPKKVDEVMAPNVSQEESWVIYDANTGRVAKRFATRDGAKRFMAKHEASPLPSEYDKQYKAASSSWWHDHVNPANKQVAEAGVGGQWWVTLTTGKIMSGPYKSATEADVHTTRKSIVDHGYNVNGYISKHPSKNVGYGGPVEEDAVDEHIVKHGSEYRLLSKKGKNLGDFSSHKAAAKHEGEVEYFKAHPKEGIEESAMHHPDVATFDWRATPEQALKEINQILVKNFGLPKIKLNFYGENDLGYAFKLIKKELRARRVKARSINTGGDFYAVRLFKPKEVAETQEQRNERRIMEHRLEQMRRDGYFD